MFKKTRKYCFDIYFVLLTSSAINSRHLFLHFHSTDKHKSSHSWLILTSINWNASLVLNHSLLLLTYCKKNKSIPSLLLCCHLLKQDNGFLRGTTRFNCWIFLIVRKKNSLQQDQVRKSTMWAIIFDCAIIGKLELDRTIGFSF